MDQAGKVAIVTGASRGVGEALARLLAAQGAKVAVAARSTGGGEGTIEGTVARIRDAGGEAIAIAADMADETQVAAMVDQAAGHFGRLDMLVNNAAMTNAQSNLDTETAYMRKALDIDLWAPLFASRAAAPHMRAAGGGRIVNVTSLVGLMPTKNMMMYGVAKLALERLTLDLAAQLKRDAIACNAFRIDLPVRAKSEFENTDSVRARNLDYAESSEVAAEGIAWMLAQPLEYTARLESMRFLREREGCMRVTAKKVFPLRHKVTIGWPAMG